MGVASSRFPRFQLSARRLEVLTVDDVKRVAAYTVYDRLECGVFKGAGEIRSGFVIGLVGGWFAARWGIEKSEDI